MRKYAGNMGEICGNMKEYDCGMYDEICKEYEEIFGIICRSWDLEKFRAPVGLIRTIPSSSLYIGLMT